MMKRVLFTALLLTMGVLSLHDLAGMVQSGTTPAGKYFSAAQLKKTVDDDHSAQSAVAGQAAIVIPPENFTIRRRVDGPNNASIHTKEGDGNDVTEVYYILEGGATYTTGGTMPDPKNRTAGIKGGQTVQLKPGDVMVIPPGSAHWFNKINGHITYIQARFPGNQMK